MWVAWQSFIDVGVREIYFIVNMENAHRRAIDRNLVLLVEKTNYENMLNCLETKDKTEIIPASFMRKWKTRLQLNNWTDHRMKAEFFEEIKKRGPKAFQLLLDTLLACGRSDLVGLLDPSTSYQSSVPVIHPKETYDEPGDHCVFIDEAWKGDCVKHDRKAIRNLFIDLGYQVKQELPTDNIASCVVVNFCNFWNDGCVPRDEDWFHGKFLDPVLQNKPKILMSFRYKFTKSGIETDSGSISKAIYNDILWVKMYINVMSEAPIKGQVSEMVKLVIEVFSEDFDSTISDRILKLNGIINKDGKLDPIETNNVRFCKLFYLKKSEETTS